MPTRRQRPRLTGQAPGVSRIALAVAGALGHWKGRGMSYMGESGVSAVYRPLDQVPSKTVGPATLWLIAPGALTDGRFALFRYDMQSRSGG
jgi:hypothetical protein